MRTLQGYLIENYKETTLGRPFDQLFPSITSQQHQQDSTFQQFSQHCNQHINLTNFNKLPTNNFKMQFTTAVFALAAAVTVSAQTEETPVFSVAEFSASCIPHSSQCLYSFTAFTPGSGETAATGVHCGDLYISDGTLPAVTDGTCTNSSRTWTVTKLDGGLEFGLSEQVTPSSFRTGTYEIPADELVKETTGASTQQRYTGPAAFDLE